MDTSTIVTPIPHVKVTWRIAGEAVLGIIALLVFWSWLSARDANIKAAAVQQANEKVIAQNDAQIKFNDQQIKLLAGQIDQLKADQARQLATNTATFARAQTPVDIAALVSKIMELQKPITFVTPPATAANPNPTPVAQVPEESVPQLKTYVQTCEECKIKLPNITAQLANTNTQLAKSEQDKQLLASNLIERTQERDQWKTAAKGGSFWSRFKRSAKYLLIGAGVGAVAVCGSGHCR
jgi:hypothetical protein